MERGAQGSGDGAHVIASVQTDVRRTERAVLAVVVCQCRGKVLARGRRSIYDASHYREMDGQWNVAGAGACAAVRRWSALPQLIARRDWRGQTGQACKASKVEQDRAAGVLREDSMYEGIW